jgi:hypothetical protein
VKIISNFRDLFLSFFFKVDLIFKKEFTDAKLLDFGFISKTYLQVAK